MLTNPLLHNQNMNSRSNDQSGGDQDPPEGNGHGCINMVRVAKVVTCAKDYGLSQPSLGKESDPPGSPLCIEKPEDKPKTTPHIPKGFLIIQILEPPRIIQLLRIWATLLVRCLHWKCFRVVLRKGRHCFLPLV